jgi:hypothetical protein
VRSLIHCGALSAIRLMRLLALVRRADSELSEATP